MKLSPNFSLSEFVDSQTAVRKNINNDPTAKVLACLKYTAQNMELVRSLLKQSVLISSGYRSPQLNAAIGGASKSQHLTGEAVDFTSPKFGSPREIVEAIKASDIVFSQMILEFDRWVHISFSKSDLKRQVLIIDGNGTRLYN